MKDIPGVRHQVVRRPVPGEADERRRVLVAPADRRATGSSPISTYHLSRDFHFGVPDQRLAAQHPDDIEAYMDGKDAYVKGHERRALR